MFILFNMFYDTILYLFMVCEIHYFIIHFLKYDIYINDVRLQLYGCCFFGSTPVIVEVSDICFCRPTGNGEGVASDVRFYAYRLMVSPIQSASRPTGWMDFPSIQPVDSPPLREPFTNPWPWVFILVQFNWSVLLYVVLFCKNGIVVMGNCPCRLKKYMNVG